MREDGHEGGWMSRRYQSVTDVFAAVSDRQVKSRPPLVVLPVDDTWTRLLFNQFYLFLIIIIENILHP